MLENYDIITTLDRDIRLSLALSAENSIKGVSTIIYKLLNGDNTSIKLEDVYDLTTKLSSYLTQLHVDVFLDKNGNSLISWETFVADAYDKKYPVLAFHNGYPLIGNIHMNQREAENINHWLKKDNGKEEEFYKTSTDVNKISQMYDLLFLGTYIYAKL